MACFFAVRCLSAFPPETNKLADSLFAVKMVLIPIWKWEKVSEAKSRTVDRDGKSLVFENQKNNKATIYKTAYSRFEGLK